MPDPIPPDPVALAAAAMASAPEPQDTVPLSSGVRRLFTSAKAIVAACAVIGVIVMNVMGKVDGPKALDFITWIVVAYFGAHAAEDAAEKFSGGKPVAQPPADYAAIMDSMVGFMPALSAMLKSLRGEGEVPTLSPRYASLEGLRARSKEEVKAALRDMLADEPPGGTVVPFRTSESPDKPPSAG